MKKRRIVKKGAIQYITATKRAKKRYGRGGYITTEDGPKLSPYSSFERAAFQKYMENPVKLNFKHETRSSLTSRLRQIERDLDRETLSPTYRRKLKSEKLQISKHLGAPYYIKKSKNPVKRKPKLKDYKVWFIQDPSDWMKVSAPTRDHAIKGYANYFKVTVSSYIQAKLMK